MAADYALWCKEARQRYLDSRHADQGALDWREALDEGREIVVGALRASDYLRSVSLALQQSGSHLLALRQLLAPPLSQDQFKLICPLYSKSKEKSGTPLKPEAADAVDSVINDWRSRRLTTWLDQNRKPKSAEIESLLLVTSNLIATQRLATARRNRLAREQEQAVIDLLAHSDWKRLPSKAIDERAEVSERHFMHKTRFASGKGQHQEVDIACGLGGTVVLAMECKVTNDETNSVKRVNDVLKKAAAWKNHWGNFVQTAALLQGVLKHADVQRLLEANVKVFWSHRLEDFGEWLETRLVP